MQSHLKQVGNVHQISRFWLGFFYTCHQQFDARFVMTPYEIILVFVDSSCVQSPPLLLISPTPLPLAPLIVMGTYHCHHSWFPCSFRGCLYHLPPLTCLQWWTPLTPLICFKIATLLASESSYMHAAVLPWVFCLLLLQTTHMHACLTTYPKIVRVRVYVCLGSCLDEFQAVEDAEIEAWKKMASKTKMSATIHGAPSHFQYKMIIWDEFSTFLSCAERLMYDKPMSQNQSLKQCFTSA